MNKYDNMEMSAPGRNGSTVEVHDLVGMFSCYVTKSHVSSTAYTCMFLSLPSVISNHFFLKFIFIHQCYFELTCLQDLWTDSL